MTEHCESDNKVAIDQSKFWDGANLNWSPHRIGWAIAGGCALLTLIVSAISILRHCRNYTKPKEQRQILRILYMPPVYAVVSFFSYRFFRDYTYYSFISIAYEAITLSAFLLLIIEYVANTAANKRPEEAIERKDKRPLPFPFCLWRYRPTKEYFLWTIKWTVMQYVIIRIAASIAGIVCEKFGVLCHSAGYDPHYASVYIESSVFISISIALYGLLWFYGLMKSELEGKRPMAKFLSIKLVVMFTFYQTFVFTALEGRVIHETRYWTETNIANGLNALAICIEMVFFSIFMGWAYSANEYMVKSKEDRTKVWKALLDSLNFSDFFRETVGSLKYYFGSRKQSPRKRNDTELGMIGRTYAPLSSQAQLNDTSPYFSSHR